jgi:hypothetical protein
LAFRLLEIDADYKLDRDKGNINRKIILLHGIVLLPSRQCKNNSMKKELQELLRWTKRGKNLSGKKKERVIITIWTGRFKGTTKHRNDCVPRISKTKKRKYP